MLSSLAEHISVQWSYSVEFTVFFELSRAYGAHVCWCCRAYSNRFLPNGAKVWSVVPFSSLVEHIKLMFAGVVELSRTYFS